MDGKSGQKGVSAVGLSILGQPPRVDLRSIHDYIAHNSHFYAKKVTRDIASKTDILDELPLMGRIVPELSNVNIRELSLYSYRILYEINDQDLFVLAVIHKRRDLQPEIIDQ